MRGYNAMRRAAHCACTPRMIAKRPRLKRDSAFRMVAMFVVLLAATLATFVSTNTTFDVVATSGSITIHPVQLMPRLYFSDAQILFNNDPTLKPFTGAIQSFQNTTIKIERVSKGPLRVAFSKDGNSTGPVGQVFGPNDLPIQSVDQPLVIIVDNLQSKSGAGSNVILSFVGSVELGSQAIQVPSMSVPVLKSGIVQVLGHSLLRRSLFRGETFTLDLGDQLSIDEPEGPANGFVLVDDNPDLKVSFRQVARSAKVLRAPSSGYSIEFSILDRLKSDGTVQSLWVALVFLWGLPKIWRSGNE